MRKRIGFIVNPIAGMGGAVGLKGTDGPALDEARRRGAMPVASERALQALGILAVHAKKFEFLTASGAMGESQCRNAGILSQIVYTAPLSATRAADTMRAATAMRATGVDLILFAGGDGTARDVFDTIGADVPILGIPAGVKMHSAVFATSPRSAAHLLLRLVNKIGEPPQLRDAEIMDGVSAPGSAKLYGYARVPHVPLLLQSAKAARPPDDDADVEAACRDVAALASDGGTSIVGPGTTMRRIKHLLGAEGTLLGVDAYRAGKPVGLDLRASDLLRIACEGPARIIVGVVGGQGYLFGRGNQQISADVIRAVGKENIVVIASLSKLLMLEQPCLLLDTFDPDVDRALAGYISVVTGAGRRTLMRVAAP